MSATVQALRATLPRVPPPPRRVAARTGRTRFAAERVERIVLAVVVSPPWGTSEEASPSPVDGARLLSGLRVIPSRGFKSRRLRGVVVSATPLSTEPVRGGAWDQ